MVFTSRFISCRRNSKRLPTGFSCRRASLNCPIWLERRVNSSCMSDLSAKRARFSQQTVGLRIDTTQQLPDPLLQSSAVIRNHLRRPAPDFLHPLLQNSDSMHQIFRQYPSFPSPHFAQGLTCLLHCPQQGSLPTFGIQHPFFRLQHFWMMEEIPEGELSSDPQPLCQFPGCLHERLCCFPIHCQFPKSGPVTIQGNGHIHPSPSNPPAHPSLHFLLQSPPSGRQLHRHFQKPVVDGTNLRRESNPSASDSPRP